MAKCKSKRLLAPVEYFEDEIPREYPIQLMEIFNKRLKPHDGKLIIIATPNSYYEKKEVNNNLDASSNISN